MFAEIEGLEEAIQQLQDLPADMHDGIYALYTASLEQGVQNAIDNSPVRTGFLQDSNSYELVNDDNGQLLFTLTNTAPYAVFVVLGTYKMSANDFMTPAADVVSALIQSGASSILASMQGGA